MDAFEFPLDIEQRELARALWHGLYQAPSIADLDEARVAFQGAPQEVRSAILKAFIAVNHHCENPDFSKNPFT